MISAEAVLDALGSPTRRQIMQILAAGPRPVGAIAERMPISRPAVSKHLRVLEGAALVDFDPRGNRNIYRLRREGFEVAQGWLDDFWDEALARFALVAENTPEVS